jgi:hypothetical protein
MPSAIGTHTKAQHCAHVVHCLQLCIPELHLS